LLPLVYLDESLGHPARARRTEESYIAVLQADGRRFGLVVDRVLNTEEIVVKSLGRHLSDIGVYAGATILGDGAVALILDVASLARRALLAAQQVDAGLAGGTDPSAGEGSAAVTELVLIVGVGTDRRVAVPLESVTRLEEFPAGIIEHLGAREVVQYRGEIVPVVRLASLVGATSAPDGPTLRAIIHSQGERTVALVVDEIVDIAEREVAPEGDAAAAVLRERVTELLDVRAAVRAFEIGTTRAEPAEALAIDAARLAGVSR
ncbi:MAG TPA: chemotaxis protein CheW, partial [Actinomycetes bacterium]|nr:chemotaxis protein CheW [Actinomycetes bacterium]